MDWADRVAHLRQWTRGHERAPHKPLLLLYALGQYQRCGNAPILYSEAEATLGQLLKEFGPPRTTSPAYPFHYMTSDGLWVVTTPAGHGSPGDSAAALRRHQAAGHLSPGLVRSLGADPQLLPQLAHIVLDSNFAPSLHDDICTAVGLDLEEAEAATSSGASRNRRDPDFPRAVLLAYEYRCAFCGYDGLLDGGFWPGLEAAHVRWFTDGGPNEVSNGLCLCSIHHKLFDRGVLGISHSYRVAVSGHFIGRSKAAEQLVTLLTDREISKPLKGYPPVAANNVQWHTREVFRAPARAS
jgi:putative restriction endonuclease